MNFIYKFILPLLSKELTLSDISLDTGFCGMATYDKNRPYLDNHIFLIYHIEQNNHAIAVRKKLASLDIHNKIDCKINGESYRIFCFPIIGKTILNLMSDITLLSEQETLQIYKFWKFTDEQINRRMVDNNYFPEKFEHSCIPEFDFSPKDFITFDKKGQALLSACP